MYKNSKIVALVPMRHNSERVPGKNYRQFAGKPLYAHIIETLLASPEIHSVVVDTDSPIIQNGLNENYPSVIVMERPIHLRDGNIPMNDVLLNEIKTVDADYYFQTHSTNPLLKPETISKAITAFLNSQGMYDSLFSVTAIKARLWDNLTRPINHNSRILLRTQDLPPVYEENSCMYLFSRGILERLHNRIGDRPLMYEIDKIESIDIDEESDFKIAERLYLEREMENI